MTLADVKFQYSKNYSGANLTRIPIVFDRICFPYWVSVTLFGVHVYAVLWKDCSSLGNCDDLAGVDDSIFLSSLSHSEASVSKWSKARSCEHSASHRLGLNPTGADPSVIKFVNSLAKGPWFCPGTSVSSTIPEVTALI